MLRLFARFLGSLQHFAPLLEQQVGTSAASSLLEVFHFSSCVPSWIATGTHACTADAHVSQLHLHTCKMLDWTQCSTAWCGT